MHLKPIWLSSQPVGPFGADVTSSGLSKNAYLNPGVLLYVI